MAPSPNDPAVPVLCGHEPFVRPPVLAEDEITYLVEDLPVGRLLLATRIDGTLLSSSYIVTEPQTETVLDRLSRRISPRILRGGRALDAVRRQLDGYFAGRLRSFDVPVDLALATPFQRTVLERLASTVRYATTTSYGRLAGDLGRPAASRAVGAALGANPLCIILPCHRVIAASGAPTGYAGGLAAKQFLLDLERTGAPDRELPDRELPDMELGGPAS